MRGKGLEHNLDEHGNGITPAYAGKRQQNNQKKKNQ